MKGFIFSRSWHLFSKSRFIKLFLVTLFSILIVNYPVFSLSPAHPEIRGVWLTTNDTNTLLDQPKLQEAIAQLSRLNFNTIYPVVWNSGYALYPSQIAQAAGIQPFVHKGFQGQDPLADLIEKAHDQGLLVLPWFEFGFMAPPTSELATKHPNWLTQKRDGTQTTISAAGEVVWLNPFRPEVQKFITSLVMEVMTRYDVDGIQFDDHLSLPSELGYDSYTVNLYKQETEKEPPANPRDEEWLKWRADKLTAYVSRLNQAIKAKKSNAIFSISPNPYDTAYRGYLQDWLTWIRQELIDELVVQVYRPDMESFVRQLKQPEIQEARQKIPTGIGILTGLRNRPIEMEFIQEKVLSAKQHGFGVSFFFYDSLWNYAPEPVAERQAKLLALFPYPAERKLAVPKPPEKPNPIDETGVNQPIEPLTPVEETYQPQEPSISPDYDPPETLTPPDRVEPEQPPGTPILVEEFTPSDPIDNVLPEDDFDTSQPIDTTRPAENFEPSAPIETTPIEEFKPYQPD